MSALDLPTLGNAFAHWAYLRPDAPALRDAVGLLTYRDLLVSMTGAARALACLPAAHGGAVAFSLADAPLLARHVLACCPFVPCLVLDPALPVEEVTAALVQARARTLVAERGSPAAQAAAAIGVSVLDVGFYQCPPRETAVAPLPLAGSCDTALILLTSGTTGRAKLVPRTHANYLANARITVAEIGVKPDDTCLLPLPLYHTLGMNNLVSNTLVSGGCAVPLGGFSPEGFATWAQLTCAQWAVMSPTVAEHLLRAMAIDPAAFAGWRPRILRLGAAATTPDLAARLITALGCRVAASYGSSEAGSISAALYPMPIGKAGSAGKVTIPGFRILGPDGRPVAPGAEGVIEVRGPTVFSGYPGPESGISAEGWFTTGDIGRLDADGFLFIVGRASSIVKRGGVKVSPEQAEAWLRMQPGVAEAACFGIPHELLGEDLVGLVAPLPGFKLDARSLRQGLLHALPGHKVPSQLLCVTSLPAGAAGKVQRAALPDLFAAALPTAGEPPRTPAEQAAADAFASTLGRGPVGRLDNFFLLGGDSLAAVSLLLHIEGVTGCRATVAELMEDPTPAGMGAIIARGQSVSHGALVVERYHDARGAAPLFVMPGADGLPHAVLSLLPYLPPDLPVLGLRAPAGLEATEAAVERAAAQVAAVIAALQPHGPCRLLGYSLGGRVAHAAARLLEAEGRPPGTLILLDPATTLTDVAGCRTDRTVGGAVFVLRSWEQPLRRLEMPGLGWEHLCRNGVSIADLPTTHFGLVTPSHAEAAARLVVAALSGHPDPWFAIPYAPLPSAFQEMRDALAAGHGEALPAILTRLPAGSLPPWAAGPVHRALQAVRSPAGRMDGAGSEATASLQNPLDVAALDTEAPPPAIGRPCVLLARALELHRSNRNVEAARAAAVLRDALRETPDLLAVAFFESANAGWHDMAWEFHAAAASAATAAGRGMAHDVAAQLHILVGRADLAVEEGRRAVAASPQVIEYRMRLVGALIATGKRAQAEEEAAAVRRLSAGRAWVTRWLDAKLAA